MTLQKFPNYMFEIVVNTGEAELGTFTIDNDGELSNLYATIMINGVASITNESIYMKAIRSSFPSIPLVSASIDVSSFVTGSSSWLGKVRFDFSNQALKANDTLQIFLGTNNYNKGPTEIGSILSYIGSSGEFEVLPNKASYLTIFSNR